MNLFESRGAVLAAEAQERVLDKQIELAKLQAAQPAQIPEPFGYVVEHNVPPTSTYKWSFHPADQGLSFYKDTALVITPVYIATAPVNCCPGSPGWPIAFHDSTIDTITDACFEAVADQGTTALMRAVARAVERQHGIFSGEGQT